MKIAFMNDSANIIISLTFDFSLEVIKYTEGLERVKKYNLSNQLFRSGTSIGANVNEAQNGESRSDFIHKTKIAAKEAEEAKYWISLCSKADSYPKPEGLLDKLQVIIKILNKIIVTSKQVKVP